MKGKDIGHVSVKAPKILELRTVHSLVPRHGRPERIPRIRSIR